MEKAITISESSNFGVMAFSYMDMRSIEALKYGYRRITTDNTAWGSITYYHDFLLTKNVYATPYVFEPYRKGTGIFEAECKRLNNNVYPILTLRECGLTKWFDKKKIGYNCIDEAGPFDVPAYDLIKAYYKDKFAKRSGLPYMNHIEEGLAIGVIFGAPEEALEAYMLHPIFQDGKEAEFDFTDIDEIVLNAASDYALVANSFLPYSGSRAEAEAALEKTTNPFLIKAMLIMDKVQNSKDFKKYNSMHPNAELLTKYFAEWYKILEAPDDLPIYAEGLITI